MSKNYMVFIVISLILLLSSFVVYSYLRKRIMDTVKKSSVALNTLKEINNKTKYLSIDRDYSFFYQCSSRAEFNHFELDNYFLELVIDNRVRFHTLIKKIKYNKKEQNKYKELIAGIDFSQSEAVANLVKIPSKLYCRTEKKLYEKMILNDPVLNVEIVCTKEYTTPSGRTHSWSEIRYDYTQLVQCYNKSKDIEKQRKNRIGQIEYERSLMTPTLRYDILKRDHFRCQICGSTAQDGVKLHIDHIIPVSKGGHTVAENLRVLCDRCNWGKSDKIE